MPKHPQRIWLAAIIVAWAVDFLFWGKPIGISFLLFVTLALLGGYALTRGEAVRPARLSLVLSGLVFIMAGITLLRSESFTRWLNALLAFVGLGLLSMTFRSGGWVRYRISDYIVASFEFYVVVLARAAGLRLVPRGEGAESRRLLLRRAAPALRGVMLAVPVVLVLGGLLASADMIFADQLRSLFKVFDLSRLPEYLFRLFYILALAYAFAGLYLQALLPTRWGAKQRKTATVNAGPTEAAPSVDQAAKESISETPQPIVDDDPPMMDAPAGTQSFPRFLGAVEALIVLGSVDTLFAFFVAIQLRYFFGGQANINAAGYTYADYARNGFFELVLVAVLSLLLYLTLNTITRLEKPIQQRGFTGLAVLLVGLVWVILASALQRLLLYEAAYGFTSLRTYTHIFIPWLGFLLLATIVLQVLRRERFFGALLLLTTFGFALTFGILNIDGFIATQNIARARAGQPLDWEYLVSLSDDALPVIVQEYSRSDQSTDIHDPLGALLACRVNQIKKQSPQPWQSYHPGRAWARQALAGLDLSRYKVYQPVSDPYVQLSKGNFRCTPRQE